MKKVIFAVVLFASMGTQLGASNINPRNFEKMAFSYKKLPPKDITAIHNGCVQAAIWVLENIIDPFSELDSVASNVIFQMNYNDCIFSNLGL